MSPIQRLSRKIADRKKFVTTRASVKVKGTATGAVTLTLVQVKAGLNKLMVTATGPGGTSAPAKMKIVRK